MNARDGRSVLLVVDADLGFGRRLRRLLDGERLRVAVAPSASHALWLLDNTPADVLVVDDGRASALDCVALLDAARRSFPRATRVLAVSEPVPPVVVEAVNTGAVDRIVEKRLDDDALVRFVEGLREARSGKRMAR